MAWTCLNLRWSCPRCGRFVAGDAIYSEDVIDPSLYYGVRSDSHYDCGRCGRIDGLPRMVEVGRITITAAEES